MLESIAKTSYKALLAKWNTHTTRKCIPMLIKALTLIAVLFSSACTVHLQQLKQSLQKTSEHQEIRISNDTLLKIRGASPITLQANSRWLKIGVIPQGNVYRTKDQEVAIQGYHSYQAYIVKKETGVVGLYIPSRNAFAPLNPVSIEYQTTEEKP